MSDQNWQNSTSTVDTAKNDTDSKQWTLIQDLVLSITTEQRRARRWSIFFKLSILAYFIAGLLIFANIGGSKIPTTSDSATAMVRVEGVIADQEKASADRIVTGLRNAFEHKSVKGVILKINSPGGSPVQSGQVFDEIKRLRNLHPETKLYAVITDIGASGAYYIAAAADEIYADKASLVGSIGVVSSSFGFVDSIKKLGVERRLMTAGEHKGFLDPFKPLNTEESGYWQEVLNTTHQQFINQVKLGRGDRLADNEKLFSGLVWSGEQAIDLGLVDALGSPGFVAREIIGEENIVDFTPKQSPFEAFAEKFGATAAKVLAQEMITGGPQLQ